MVHVRISVRFFALQTQNNMPFKKSVWDFMADILTFLLSLQITVSLLQVLRTSQIMKWKIKIRKNKTNAWFHFWFTIRLSKPKSILNVLYFMLNKTGTVCSYFWWWYFRWWYVWKKSLPIFIHFREIIGKNVTVV